MHDNGVSVRPCASSRRSSVMRPFVKWMSTYPEQRCEVSWWLPIGIQVVQGDVKGEHIALWCISSQTLAQLSEQPKIMMVVNNPVIHHPA